MSWGGSKTNGSFQNHSNPLEIVITWCYRKPFHIVPGFILCFIPLKTIRFCIINPYGHTMLIFKIFCSAIFRENVWKINKKRTYTAFFYSFRFYVYMGNIGKMSTWYDTFPLILAKVDSNHGRLLLLSEFQRSCLWLLWSLNG